MQHLMGAQSQAVHQCPAGSHHAILTIIIWRCGNLGMAMSSHACTTLQHVLMSWHLSEAVHVKSMRMVHPRTASSLLGHATGLQVNHGQCTNTLMPASRMTRLNSACAAFAASRLTGRSYKDALGWRPPIIRLVPSGSQTMTISASSFSCSWHALDLAPWPSSSSVADARCSFGRAASTTEESAEALGAT